MGGARKVTAESISFIKMVLADNTSVGTGVTLEYFMFRGGKCVQGWDICLNNQVLKVAGIPVGQKWSV